MFFLSTKHTYFVSLCFATIATGNTKISNIEGIVAEIAGLLQQFFSFSVEAPSSELPWAAEAPGTPADPLLSGGSVSSPSSQFLSLCSRGEIAAHCWLSGPFLLPVAQVCDWDSASQRTPERHVMRETAASTQSTEVWGILGGKTSGISLQISWWRWQELSSFLFPFPELEIMKLLFK